MRKILGALLGVALALGLSVGVAGNAFACASANEANCTTAPPTVQVTLPPVATPTVTPVPWPHPWPTPVGVPLPIPVGTTPTPCGCGGTTVVVTGTTYTVPATDPWWPGYGVVAGWNTGLNSQACLSATFAVQQQQQFNTVFLSNHGWLHGFAAARARALALANISFTGLVGGPIIVPTDLAGLTFQVYRLQQWLPTLAVGSPTWDQANALLLALQNVQAQCNGVSVGTLNAVYGNWWTALHGVRSVTLTQLLQEQAIACG